MPAHKLTDDMTWKQIVEKTALETDSENDFKEWMLSKENVGGYFFDPHTWKVAYKVVNKINNQNKDHFAVISGEEGSGKSTFSMQFASVVDPSFNREQMFNSRIALETWIRNNLGKTKGKALIVDEGNLVLFGRESLSGGSIEIIKLLTLVRQCNMLLIVNIPSYPTIDSYIRKHRVSSLFLINQERKTFRHYGRKGVAYINEALRKGVQMSEIYVPDHLFYSGYWNKSLPKCIEEANYVATKLDAFKDFLDSSIEKLQETDNKIEKQLISTKEARQLTGKGVHQIRELIIQGEIQGKKMGQRWYIDKKSLLSCPSKPQVVLAGQSINYTKESI